MAKHQENHPNVRRLACALWIGTTLVLCGCSSQAWTFSRSNWPGGSPATVTAARLPLEDIADAERLPAPVETVQLVSYEEPAPGMPERSEADPFFDQAASPRFDVPIETMNLAPLPAEPAVTEMLDEPFVQRLPPLPDEVVSFPATPSGRLGAMWAESKMDFLADVGNYYSCAGMRDLALGIGVAAVVANTRMDADFQEWYQRDVRGGASNRLSQFWKPFGEGGTVLPAMAVLGLAGRYFEDRPILGGLGEFGDRATRAYLVGGPSMLLLQWAIGSSRPEEVQADSRWRPFQDNNGISGHAFVGAVPFLTAANMVENPWAKGFFVVCSVMPGWTRINDNCHYLSQVGLGWWLAYLSCRAVNTTEQTQRQFNVIPIMTPEMSGVGVVFQR